MALRIAVFCALVSLASAAPTSCKTTPGLCQGTCLIDPTISKGSNLDLGVKGTCSEAVSAPTYSLGLKFNGLPILSKKGQDACKDNKFDLPLGMGSVSIPAVKCPVAAGDALVIPAVASVAKSAPNGKLVATLAAEDKSGKSLFSIEYDVSLGSSGTSSRGLLRGSRSLELY